MKNGNEPQPPKATPAANTASVLLELIKDPTTPQVVRLGLVAMVRGMATKVAEVVAPSGDPRPKTVSETQALEHLSRWIANAERLNLRPQPGTLPAFVQGE